MAIPSDAILFASRLNWRETYSVSYEFKTDIIEVRTGDEQRRAIRRSPRRSLDFTVTHQGAAARVFRAQLAYQQARRFVMPEWTRYVTLLADMAANAVTATLDGTDDWLVKGAIVVLVQEGASEVRTLASLAGATITFTEHGTAVWPAGSRLYQGMIGRFQPQLTATRSTPTVMESSLTFDEDPASESYPYFWNPRLAPGQTFHNLELLTLRPNWLNTISSQRNATVTLLDYGQGVVEYDEPNNLRSETMQGSYLGVGLEGTRTAIDLFHRVKGQRGSFYAPTWDRDIELAVPFVAGDTTLTAQGTELATYFTGDRVYRNIVMVTPDGFFPFGVAQMTVAGANTSILLDQPIPLGLDSDDVSIISWLPLRRMATDKLTIAWQTPTVSQFTLSMKTLADAFGELNIAGLRLVIGGDYIVCNQFPPPYLTSQATFKWDYFTINDNAVLINDTYVRIGGAT